MKNTDTITIPLRRPTKLRSKIVELTNDLEQRIGNLEILLNMIGERLREEKELPCWILGQHDLCEWQLGQLHDSYDKNYEALLRLKYCKA